MAEPLTPDELAEIKTALAHYPEEWPSTTLRLVANIESAEAEVGALRDERDAAYNVIRRLLIDHVDPRTHPLGPDWPDAEAAAIRAATEGDR